MQFFTNVLIFGGLILMLIGLAEVMRKVRWGSFASGGVSDVNEVMRLQELNRKTRDDITETETNAKNCFQIYRVLATTRFRNMTEPSLFVLRDSTWQKAREQAVRSAGKGFKDCEKFLRISMDSAILMLREAFRFSIETCVDCPLVKGKPGDIKQCPITETLKTEAQHQQQ